MLTRSVTSGPKNGVGDWTDLFLICPETQAKATVLSMVDRDTGCVGVFHGKESRKFCREVR